MQQQVQLFVDEHRYPINFSNPLKRICIDGRHTGEHHAEKNCVALGGGLIGLYLDFLAGIEAALSLKHGTKYSLTREQYVFIRDKFIETYGPLEGHSDDLHPEEKCPVHGCGYARNTVAGKGNISPSTAKWVREDIDERVAGGYTPIPLVGGHKEKFGLIFTGTKYSIAQTDPNGMSCFLLHIGDFIECVNNFIPQIAEYFSLDVQEAIEVTLKTADAQRKVVLKGLNALEIPWYTVDDNGVVAPYDITS